MADLIHNLLPQPPRTIVSIDCNETVKKCIDLMMDFNIGALVVIDGTRFMGIVSERDIIRACLHQNLDISKTKAADVVFTDVTTLTPHDSVEAAMEAITHTKRRHILIRDNGELVAILSIGDLLYHLLEDKSRVIEHLKDYIYT